MKRLSILFLLSPILLLAGCDSEDDPPPPPPPGEVLVRMDDIAFIDPDGNRNENSVVRIDVGETVRWENQDSVDHTVTSTSVPSGADSFDEQNMSPGDDFEVTFDTPGTYVYVCELHPGIMLDARVIVE